MTRDDLKTYITEHFDGLLKPLETGKYDPLYEVAADKLLEVAQALKNDENLKFDFLCNLGGVDTGEHFEAVYNIASITNNLRLDFKVIMPYDGAEVESLQEIWPAINWYEREMWELYGINIKNHDNLTRFLLPDDWDQGHPMRKDWDAPDFERMPEP
ncbi:MAG: NADH-quinone oxidoreductase subunit C [candidate division Zixibacteria bacterium]|nr:NADH-quinone oxidoreductase subunit C [candidate division Zixibacteria bacterium]